MTYEIVGHHSGNNCGNLIATIQKNAREFYGIAVRKYKGHELVDIRIWFIDTETGEFKPTGKGLSLKANCLRDIISALRRVVKESPNG